MIEAPRFEAETILRDHVADLKVDLAACADLLKSEDISDRSISELTIDTRVTSPAEGKYYRWKWNRSLGIFIHHENKICLNVPKILDTRHNEDCNSVLLHELGHAVDYNRGTMLIQDEEKITPALLLGAWSVGTFAPASAVYLESGSMPETAMMAAFGFIGSAALMGYSLEKLDKKRLTLKGRVEGFAEDFVEKHKSSYPALISVTT